MALFGSSKSKTGADAGEMSFLQHLEALRWHLVRSVVAIVIFGIAAFWYVDFLTDAVLLAPTNTGFITYRALCHLGHQLNMGDQFCVTEIPMKIINTEIGGQFNNAMWISIVSGLVLSFPYVIWELWRFIKPALQEKEKRYARGIVFYTSLLFLLGVAFGYFVITPMSVNFLANFKISAMIENNITLDSIISIVTTMTLITGVVFELPIVVYFLTKIGIMSPSFMRKYRRHAAVVILILAAIITPTADATTMVFVAIPLYVLYEISIFVSVRVMREQEA